MLKAIEWLSEQMPGGFFIYKADEPLDIIFANKATYRIFGCDTAEEFRELTGNTFDGMVHPEDYSVIQHSIDSQIDSDSENQMDHVVYRIKAKDGSIRWVDDYGHYATLPGYGNVYYVFINDITDTHLVEEEQKKNRILKEALEAAEQANIAKTAFLSNMSHEIRTPITAILGMNDIIRNEFKDPTLLAYTDNIKKAGSSLLGIISDILDFSKIESGKVDIVNTEYQLADVIGDVYNMIQFRAEEKGLAVYLEVDSKLPRVLLGDDLRIKQILSNLMTNAIKYTAKGSVLLRVTYHDIQADRVKLYVSVEDTGIGIPKEEMGRLFETFSRLDVKRTHTIEGAGLGLPICRELLEHMDSELKVKSEYNKGSVFSFELEQGIVDSAPIGDFLATLTERERRHQSSENFTFKAPASRILVVDDTPMNLQVITGLLKQTNMQVDAAKSGMEALEKIAVYPYDLVFLDYRMPHMDGIETLESIKEKYPEKASETPIISLTASAVAGDRERMLDAGFTDYVSKPIHISELNDILLEYLPDDEIIPMEEQDEQEEESETPKLPPELYHIPWLDPEEGVSYCGDADLYLLALDSFAAAIDEKASLIEACLYKADWDLYIITVHALKSTSKVIGAEEFSEQAKALELAGKAGEYNRLRKDTPGFLRQYRSLKKDLARVL